nr:hypothetical protein [Candidatus Njordarchaeum guaymaensis]
MFTRRYTVTVTQEMHKMLDEERKKRFLDSIPETIRMILSEYLSKTRSVTSETLRADKDSEYFQ